MASYGYTAIAPDGKEKKGTIEAANLEAARGELKKDRLIPIDLREQSVMTKDIEIGGSVKPRDLSVFCRQFVSMTRAGVPILEAMNLLTTQTENRTLKRAIKAISLDIEKGEPLSESLAKHPKIFNNLMCSTVAAGEAAGNIDIAFDRMAVQYEKTAKLKAQITKAAIYPIFVCIMAIGIILLMLLYVIPQYETMFEQLGTELPAITQTILNMSKFLQNYWYIALIVIAAIVAAIIAFGKTETGKLFYGTIKMKIPIFGLLNIKTNCSLFARTMATMLESGVPMVESIEITARTMTNIHFERALQTAEEDVQSGLPLSRPLENAGIFPPMVYHMIHIGEESGTTEDMMTKLADYYDEEVEQQTQTVMAAIEPMIIVVLAIIVIILVAAIMMPMLKMYQDLSSL